MDITLRNVSHNARLSEETYCYAADVYIDGVKSGTVENRGHGGSNMYHPRALEERLDAYAATLPSKEAYGMTLPETADSLCDDQLSRYVEAKRLKRLLKQRVLTVAPDGSGILQTRVLTPDQQSLVATDSASRGETVLNTMPFEDALTLFLRVTAGEPATAF